MDETKVIKGEWFLPKTPDNKVFGTLTIAKDERAKLTTFHLLKEEFHDEWYEELILGEATSGEKFTLYRCSLNNFSSGKKEQDFTISYALIGFHFYEPNAISFQTVKVKYRNLKEWINISGFKMRSPKKNISYTIKYNQPKPVNFIIDDDFNGTLDFEPNVNINKRTTYTLLQDVYLRLESYKGEKRLEILVDYLNHFRDFLALSTYQPSLHTSVSMSSDKEGVSVQVIYKTTFSRPQVFARENGISFLYNYLEVKGKFKRIIKKWYSNRSTIDIVMKLFLETIYNRGFFDESVFLGIVQGLETFHRRRSKNKKVPENKHKRRISEVLNAVPEKHREFVKSRLEYSNEPSLRTRLKALINEFNTDFFDKVVKEKKGDFIHVVVESRNYYTHLDPSKKDNKYVMKGPDLYYLTEKLKILFTCIILKETGFNLPEINNFLSKIKYNYFYHLIK